MPPKFGTSGLRGLVTELTPALIADHVAAFVATCPVGTGLFIGMDLRPSSPQIARVVADTAKAAGLKVTDCGALPTPALALAAMDHGAAAIMVTGSHIPADRNGLKFYTPRGEITKDHETAILGGLGARPGAPAPGVLPEHMTTAADTYAQRYIGAYGTALAGQRVGVYAHSSVGRDLLADVLRALGADVAELGRSDSFIPVDTEAVSSELKAQLRAWAAEQQLDAIVSTDGDADRPLMADETGRVVPGDILGQITAQALGAQTVVTPVSSNSGVEALGTFDKVVRTRIGSPYVIAGMEKNTDRTVGYEANGGFLLGFTAQGPAGPLPALMTRDAFLPIIATLAERRGRALSAVVADQPPLFTASDRLQEVPTAWSQALLDRLNADGVARTEFLARFDGVEAGIDRTDGLRITLADGRTVHLRPSGNAPELRFYAEAATAEAAEATLAQGLTVLRAAVDAGGV